MIPAHLWRLVDADPAPRPRRGPIPATGHYRAGGPVRRSLTAVALDALRTGVRVEERVGGVWRPWMPYTDRLVSLTGGSDA